MEEVILVDALDNVTGKMEKMEAHIKGEMHRAISVLIFNTKGEMMLQQRAFSKYHSPGLWTNTCCSHPRPEELSLNAALRRLKEEMGFTTELEEKFTFAYQAEFENGLIENEFDHVFFGIFEGNVVLNPDEAQDYKWIKPYDLLSDMVANTENFTIWFRIMINKMRFAMPELFANQ
jgi:isopentenyl-diphosphate delta-isomerase